MQRVLVAAILMIVLHGSLAWANAVDALEFQRIIDSKCSQCHPPGRIEQAIERGDDVAVVIEKMLRLGARLSPQEQQVLGVFWRERQQQPPALPQGGATVAADPLGHFRQVLESRCTGCHGLDLVEAAMAEGRSLTDLIELMRQRGAIITEADQNALAPFWGSPYKQK